MPCLPLCRYAYEQLSKPDHVGNIETSSFMSDCAEQYYNAWFGVFGTHNSKRLLCIWHVDQTWRTALNEHIPNRQERIEVYHQLCILLK